MLQERVPKILVVDDEAQLRSLLTTVLTTEGFKVVAAEDGAAALEKLVLERPSAVILDLRMPRVDGIEALRRIHGINRRVPVIILTAYGEVTSAVQAMKLGAYDFLSKPFSSDFLVSTVRQAMQREDVWGPAESRQDQAAASVAESMGRSPQSRRVLELVRQVAGTNFTVLLQGETGTGKELVARAIHDESRRRTKSFVPIDCGAIPETLIESELFGHERGAFTGADRRRDGLFVVATGGTLFLDEVTNLPLATQTKLLRAIQERCILPLGAKRAVPVDVRIIAASNISVETASSEGRFREDLYFRLNEFCIAIPPLRERKDDIVYLAKRFLEEVCGELDKDVRGFSEDALEVLLAYPWRGNVRQLRNAIRRASLVCQDEIQPEHLAILVGMPPWTGDQEADGQQLGGHSLSLKEIRDTAVGQVEHQAIRRALLETKGNRTRAAKLLGVDYKTLYLKMRRYGIRTKAFLP